ncbi:sodium:proton antiporter [Floricoccus penangensis]|uniref:Sodium:proton antiporter n=1 Tax=Floricoccus penangensis TaxID=1859475 RepID=A0A9Q5P010_9LACT|nr:sodium:proton antiporter [Floricoccus penangensis]OFI47088.1 sodium:proton antiporter [Floricoccus penangensis]
MDHQLIFFIIGFLSALIASNIINRVFPKIPLPFIQVVLGIIMATFGADQILKFDPEVFLAFGIAPLLFREGEEANVPSIMKHWRTVAILVLPVVFITAVVMGFAAHSFFPTMPLAACVAIGASLGPTDAVAVSSLASRFDFPKRIKSILSGEGLLNDASGIIAFQFALLALTTGKFSLANASVQFVISALGGALIGYLVSWLNNTILSLMEDVAAQDVVGYLLLELMMPLLAFSLSELLHVSGIIAVVVAGVLQAAGFKKITLFDAQVNQVSSTIWDTIVFMLNGVVFIFLGIELETIAHPVLKNDSYDNWTLLLIVFVLTVVLFATRFVLLAIYYKIISIKRKQPFERYKSDLMLLTFAGVKGTVSIATIMLIPHAVAQKYNMMIFTTAGVTMLSFLSGIIILPMIAPKKEGKANYFGQIAILNDVVLALQDDLEKTRVKDGYYATIDNYTQRIQKFILMQESEEATEDFNNLQLMILQIEEDSLNSAYSNGDISINTYRVYHRYLKELERSITHSLVSSLTFAVTILFRAAHMAIVEFLHLFRRKKGVTRKTPILTDEDKQELKDLYLQNTELVLSSLYNLYDVYDSNLINLLGSDRLRSAELVAEGDFKRLFAHYRPNNIDEMTRGYYLERKLIAEYEARGEITSAKARQMRKNVNTLEDYSMNEEYSSLLYDFLEYRGGRN